MFKIKYIETLSTTNIKNQRLSIVSVISIICIIMIITTFRFYIIKHLILLKGDRIIDQTQELKYLKFCKRDLHNTGWKE